MEYNRVEDRVEGTDGTAGAEAETVEDNYLEEEKYSMDLMVLLGAGRVFLAAPAALCLLLSVSKPL